MRTQEVDSLYPVSQNDFIQIWEQNTADIIWSEQSESGKLCTGALPLSPRIKGTTTHDTLQNTDSFNLS